ncbi:MAG: hemerythrin domain-containing protein [Candidatus Eremiobacteraeota bacterium]|nr:hemerythrin domain-containing protein [Candidatus Eremiobacteraeota bacterium]MBV8354913.1 hemerythrin domain-containing protein [Candidatus Eremiobacteraeota bacterium]
MPTTTRRTSRTASKSRARTNGAGNGARTNGTGNILVLLKRDHQEVKDMFEQIEGLSERATEQRRRLGEKICTALEAHSKLEKAILYSEFRQRAEDHEEREEVLEAYEEHEIVDRLVSELKGMNPSDERYEAKMMVLAESVRHHIKEEEGEMFRTVRELFEKDELAEMGQRFAEGKRRAGLE